MKELIKNLFEKNIKEIQKKYEDLRKRNIELVEFESEALAECVDYNRHYININIYFLSILDIISKYSNGNQIPENFIQHLAYHEFGHSNLGNSKEEKQKVLKNFKMAYLKFFNWGDIFRAFNEFQAEYFTRDNDCEFHQLYVEYKLTVIQKGIEEVSQNCNKKLTHQEKLNYLMGLIEWVDSFYLYDLWDLLEKRFKEGINHLDKLHLICEEFERLLEKSKKLDELVPMLENLAWKFDKEL